ncbi:MAG: marine proteobacterial sortase target protein, partial [Woeseiaceae bacterium]|nr:marine proteobacterial sortase target protein [Woeseiaceae bacterium]
VDHLRLYIGDRFIEGEIREKQQARKEYEQAKSEGRKASLVEQQRPNLFTTSVANIGPGERVVVEIEYLEDLDYDNGTFSVRFPMTITPRYIPGVPTGDRVGSGWAADTTSVPDASLVTPPMVSNSTDHRLTMDVSLNAGVPLEIVASRYHPVNVAERNGRYEISLASGAVEMDHDFELLWRPAPAAAPRALVFNEIVDGEPHYLVMVMPPSADLGERAQMPREMLFIIDTSGSMHGTSIEQARKALRRALDGLQPGDRFNIIAFSSHPNPLFAASVNADPGNLSKAFSFVDSLQANGGTEMRAALRLAFSTPPRASHLRQVIFITDGAVGNEDELFRMIERQLSTARLFTVGIGSAPNSWFMRKAAEAGRGTFTTISSLHEVGEKMDRLFTKIEQPQVTNIQVDWPGGVVVDSYPETIPDLYLGEPVTVKARITGPLQARDEVGISGDSVGGAWQQKLRLGGQKPAPGVGALWARARIAALSDQRRRGADADEIRDSIVRTAIRHHLVSRHTSLVAVDKTPSRFAGDPLRRDQVPNLMAHGQSGQAIFGFPATATDARQLQMTGAALIVLGLLAGLALRRREPRHDVYA